MYAESLRTRIFFVSSNSDSAKTIGVSGEQDPNSLSEEFLEVANGCLCCSVKDTGIAAIEKLMTKRGRFDYILLETTGLADPGGLVWIGLVTEDV